MKKKVGVIGVKGLPGYGGSSRANDQILRRLSDKYEITVYAIDSHADKKNYKGINQYIYKSFKNKKINSIIYFIRSSIHALLFRNYELIHINHGVSGFILPLLSIKYKIVLTIRGLNYSGDDKWNFLEFYFLKFFEWISFNLSDVVTTVQNSSVNYIKKRSTKKVVWIPNGVNNNFPNFSTIEKENIITLSAARLIHLKGVHDFLEALRKIKFEEKIRIIGDLDQVPSYRKRIINLSNELNVEFTGLITDQRELFSLISASSLYIFPSYSEGMSNMLLEVASLKVPVIASNILPNKDIFTEDEVIFFPVGNVEVLSEKIKYYWDNKDEANVYANNAYNKVIKEYSWNNIAAEYSKVYNNILN